MSILSGYPKLPNADAGFVYLVLHGVGYSGSDISMVQNVDYVMRQNGVFRAYPNLL